MSVGQNAVYGRIVNGVIAEFPVLDIHIETRGHPKEWYTPAVYEAPPVVAKFTVLVDVPSIRLNEAGAQYILVSRDTRELSLEELFMFVPGNLPEEADVTAADIDMDLIMQIQKLSTRRAQEDLDEFAKTRGYDDIKSLTDYRDSIIPKFKEEGLRGQFLRDMTWVKLYQYADKLGSDIMSGQPFVLPTSYDALKQAAELPLLTWE